MRGIKILAGAMILGIMLLTYLIISVTKENERIVKWIRTDPARAKRWSKDNREPEPEPEQDQEEEQFVDLNKIENENS
jgi:hypothetical protein